VSEREAAKHDEELKAARELAELQDETDAARADLVQVRQEVAEEQDRLVDTRAAHLLAANEQLVVSTLRAQAEVEICTQALAEASRLGDLDPLTELASRALLIDRMEQLLAGARRHPHLFALLFLDLDGFKRVNDALGHAAGDQVLKQTARCLESSVRETDTVCRYGGDEFVILLAEVADGNDAGRVAEKVIEALAAARPEGDPAGGLTASIGISLYPDDAGDAPGLIERADRAMYRAKERRPGSFVFHGRPDASS
jgi:diguanylate cyclase (GGDEF)-like protein